MHLVLARDILPNNTSAIRPILAPSVQQQGRGRVPSSPITDGTDYLSTVPQELGRDYQNPVRTAWTAVRTGLCGTLSSGVHKSKGAVISVAGYPIRGLLSLRDDGIGAGRVYVVVVVIWGFCSCGSIYFTLLAPEICA